MAKEKPSGLAINWKWAAAPIIFAAVLRYAPYYAYGNTRIYEKAIPYEVMENFLSEETILELRDWIKSERRFATAIEAAARGVVSIGEDEPLRPDGTCDETTFTSANEKTCHFSGRLDIFKHFVVQGGYYGAKETVTKLFASIYSFINYYPEAVEEERIKKLFKNEVYNRKINNICKGGFSAKGVDVDSDVSFRPTQVNIVMLPPGMDLPLHQDNQWFWGVNQMSAPDWLLHVMKESGLFDDIMIPQAQGVSYLHGSIDEPYYTKGGRYVFYPNGPGAPSKSLRPKRGQAIMMDGGRMIHGVERTHPGFVVGHLRRGAFNRIEYQGNDTWYMMSDDDLVDVFSTDDFRITFVWRGLCFKDEDERKKFETQLENEDYMDLNYVLSKLERDLHKRGKLAKHQGLQTMGPKVFGKLLQKVYMQYPLDTPDAWFPVNYCALGYQKPWLETLLSPFCTDVRPRNPINHLHPPPLRFCDPKNRTRRMTNCPDGYQGEI